MSLFSKLKKDDSVKESGDFVGRKLLHSGIYDAKIKLAFQKKSAKGALGVEFHFEIGDRTEVQTIWVTKTTGEYTYKNKQGDTMYMPGYILVDDICRLTIDQEISEIETEEKVVKLFNWEEKKELPQKVQAMTDLHGQEIKLCIQEAKEWRKDVGKVQDKNIIAKALFFEDGRTVTEIMTEKDSKFAQDWLDKWEGQIYDRTDGKTEDNSKSDTKSKSKKELFK